MFTDRGPDRRRRPEAKFLAWICVALLGMALWSFIILVAAGAFR